MSSNCIIQFDPSSNFTDITSLTFNGMSSGNTINIPNSVTYIGIEAFSNIAIGPNLTVIFEPDSSLNTIHPKTFQNSYVTEIDVPGKVISIQELAFESSHLTSVYISQSVETIDSQVFQDCSGLTEIVYDIESHHVTVGNEAFKGCSSLALMYMPPSMRDISNNAFDGCTNLNKIYMNTGTLSRLNSLSHVGNSLTFGSNNTTNGFFGGGSPSGGNYSFEIVDDTIKTPIIIQVNNGNDISNSDLSGNITFDNITNILNSNSPSSNISEITSVTIGNQITGIAGETFQACSGLTEIFIPDSVTNIDTNAFKDCTSLSDVYMTVYTLNELNNNVQTLNLSFNTPISFFGASNVTIHHTKFLVGVNPELAGAVNILGGAKVAVVQLYTSIYKQSFQNATTLTRVFLPDSITSIGDYAFSGCNSLQSINLQGLPIQTIGASAFSSCYNLQSINLQGLPIQTIGDNAFNGSTSLHTVNLQDSAIQTIGNYAFHGCNSLQTVNLQNSAIQTIGNYAFVDTSLQSINLQDLPIQTIGNYAFYLCDELNMVNLQDSAIQTIGDNAFNGSTSLHTVNLQNSAIQTIGNNAFQYCFNLESIDLPQILTSIGKYAFSSSGLTSINMANNTNIKIIEKGTFQSASSLKTVILPPNLERIETYGFLHCDALSGEIVFGSNCNYIGEGAFQSKNWNNKNLTQFSFKTYGALIVMKNWFYARNINAIKARTSTISNYMTNNKNPPSISFWRDQHADGIRYYYFWTGTKSWLFKLWRW